MVTYTNIQVELLLKEIDKKREKMISTANTTGFTSDETIKCSQELDELINRYHQNKMYKKRKRVLKILFHSHAFSKFKKYMDSNRYIIQNKT